MSFQKATFRKKIHDKAEIILSGNFLTKTSLLKCPQKLFLKVRLKFLLALLNIHDIFRFGFVMIYKYNSQVNSDRHRTLSVQIHSKTF